MRSSSYTTCLILATLVGACTQLSAAAFAVPYLQTPGVQGAGGAQPGPQLNDRLPGIITPSPFTASGNTIKAAEALFKEGKYGEAYDAIMKAQKLIQVEGREASYNVVAYEHTAAFSLIELGDDSAALNWLGQEGLYGGGTYVNEYAAIALARTGRVPDAVRLLNKFMVDYSPAPIKKLWNDVKQVEATTSVIIAARHYLGEDATSQNDYRAALHHFKAAQSLDSHSTLIAYDLGTAYAGLGKYRDAAVNFAWAARAGNPDVSKAAKTQLERVRANIAAEASRVPAK